VEGDTDIGWTVAKESHVERLRWRKRLSASSAKSIRDSKGQVLAQTQDRPQMVLRRRSQYAGRNLRRDEQMSSEIICFLYLSDIGANMECEERWSELVMLAAKARSSDHVKSLREGDSKDFDGL